MLEFAKVEGAEKEAIQKIVARAHAMYQYAGTRRRKLDIRMDIEAVHAKVPLRLAELAEADEFNFAHDIAGIAHHLNRTTGELEDFFVPRFAKPEPAAAA